MAAVCICYTWLIKLEFGVKYRFWYGKRVSFFSFFFYLFIFVSLENVEFLGGSSAVVRDVIEDMFYMCECVNLGLCGKFFKKE